MAYAEPGREATSSSSQKHASEQFSLKKKTEKRKVASLFETEVVEAGDAIYLRGSTQECPRDTPSGW